VINSLNEQENNNIINLCISAVTVHQRPGYPEPMYPFRMVNDFSGLLNPADLQKLESKLESFYYETSTQIYIVILDDLKGYDISDFAFRLVRNGEWVLREKITG